MQDPFDTILFMNDTDRVDGIAKVTGKGTYSAEYDLPGLHYGVIVHSGIAKGKINTINAAAAERMPGVVRVISHLNSPRIPNYYEEDGSLKKPNPGGQEFRIFTTADILFHGQPVALVIADTLEHAIAAAELVKVEYTKEAHQSDIHKLRETADTPRGASFADYSRGDHSVWASAPKIIEAEYTIPLEVHHPMELHSTIAQWTDGKLLVYDKTQGVKSSQRSIMNAFKLKEEDVQVISHFVGGGFGSALRTWPHVIATVMGAKAIGKPLKVVLTRQQMFTMVGYRPYSIQNIKMAADDSGKLIGIDHDAISHTSSYENFTERIIGITKSLHHCENVKTSYKILPLDLSTPTWMRGPGEATGSFALESALDELAYTLKMDPLEFRLKNYAETDLERDKPYSSKFLKEAYAMGAEKFGWNNRSLDPLSMTEGKYQVGYGMGVGQFHASRGVATARARLMADGRLIVQSAVADSGPGTATTMVQIAAEAFGAPLNKVTFEMGDSSLPPGPTQGGSTTTSTLGSAVHDTCKALQKKMLEFATKQGSPLQGTKPEDLVFEKETIRSTSGGASVSYIDLLKNNDLPFLEVITESRAGPNAQNYSMYSFAVHFVKVLVNPLTKMVSVNKVVTVVDAGKIISDKQARSQMLGGVVSGIGMALTEEAVIDHRYGQIINSNFADYHVPVHADIPAIDVLFVDKPDPHINPVGAKGMGEVSIVGFAAAVANAVFHATGKRVRDLPITVDKLL